ncbi:helix-turn-helix domain-containing protein [Paludifilum halophilum]|uniref:HTH araC/xylS-type domain-containing protein n=1 Tax=Paludifilum halophilum TaxID=1642702 RepID=A0A235B3N4_9BACL|nr:helix-turn-helix domain-containing protein [Paludifilum halophilum]OYD06245.1 hypothetical protein CHM34_17445 [Paludifilum halophilum]
MVKLLIADRDPKERYGLEWLVRSYPVPFDPVLLAEDAGEAEESMEQEAPQVLCLELDMVPRDRWETFKKGVSRHVQAVIGVTAEATFERAIQAIELQAEDLWVKPISPDRIKRSLHRIYRQTAEKESSPDPSVPASVPPLSYRSLFLDREQTGKPGCLWMIQPEHSDRVPVLLDYLEEYPFHTRPLLFPLSDTVVCVFPPTRSDEKKHFHREGHRLLSDWSSRLEEPLSLALHWTRDPSISLRQRYLFAKQALELRFFKGYHQVLTADEPVNWISIDPFLTPDEQRTWMNMLEQGDREGLKKWLYDQFLQLSPPFPEPGLLRIRLTSILAQLRRFMQTHALHRDPSFENEYHQVFSTILYRPILYRIVQDLLLFIYDILEGAEQNRKKAAIDVVETGIRYMENHYHRSDLTLREVARHVGRNATYFSHLLSHKKKTTFRQIMTGIRLNHAKRQLEETHRPIQEIADRVGFKNTNYFSRVFKKNVGLSPRAYRNQRKNQNLKQQTH